MATSSSFNRPTSLLTDRAGLRAYQRTQARKMFRLREESKRRYEAREAELSSLLSFMQSAAEDEKGAMARGLHDELGGVLTSAKIDISWLRKALATGDADIDTRLERLSKAIDEAVNVERRVVENLRPSLLDHLGLGAALDWYVSDACKSASVDCRRRSFDDATSIAPALAIVVFRVVQEALTNILAHAEASEIRISLKRDEDGLHLNLIDDGKGLHIDPSPLQQQRFALMRQRALALGGSFELDQPDGGGTRLRAFFPAVAESSTGG